MPTDSRVLTSTRLAALVLAVLIGVLVGAGLHTAIQANALSYLSDDPAACVNCHIMRDHFDGWQKASHHIAATCNDCHVPHGGISKWYVKMENGYHHSKAFTLENFSEPIRLREESRDVVIANCIACHGQITSEIAAHAGLAAEPLDCTRCHAAVGHGPRR